MLDETLFARADAADQPGDPTAERIGHDLTRLLRAVARLRHQTDMGAVAVLGLLIEHGPQRVGEIAQALGTDPSTVSRKVAALVDAGFVERRVAPAAGRAHRLAATPAGEQKMQTGRQHRTDMVTAVLSGWPEDARRELAGLLGRFADEMQEHGARVVRASGGEDR